MKRTLVPLLVIGLVGCGTSRPSSPPAEKDVYRFNYHPYDAIQVTDRPLYNYLFSIIRNKLIFYVLESDPHASEPYGVILELDISQTPQSLVQRRDAPALRGWFLFEEDVLPVDDTFLHQYTLKTLPDTYRDMAKASFWVEKRGNETYRVYVRYWIKTVVREFLHTVKKQGGTYTIVATEPLALEEKGIPHHAGGRSSENTLPSFC